MEKSEVIQKDKFTFRWSENIKFYIFTSENIKYTLYFINIFLYFTTLYIINCDFYVCKNYIRTIVESFLLLLKTYVLGTW